MSLHHCPCGQSAPYSECCAPYHRGAEPADAATLMQARYAAFVSQEHAFLVRTLHSQHDDRARGEAALFASLRQHGQRARYKRLQVLDSDGPDSDGVARVLFHVVLALAGRDASFTELSSFVREGGWRYISGRSWRGRAPAFRTIAEAERG